RPTRSTTNTISSLPMASCGARPDPIAPPATPPGSEAVPGAGDGSPAGASVFRAGAVYVVLTVLLTYPLALRLRVMDAGDSAAFAFSPIRTDQIAHLSTLGTQYLPLVLLFIFRFFRLGTARDALLAALFFALEAYACGYHGVVGLLVLPVAVAPLVWGRWGRLPVALLAAAVAAVGLLPLYLLHHAALAPLHYTRGPEETARFSAAVESFLAT